MAPLIGNVISLILAGWWLALARVGSGIALCSTIIGVPLGIANFKLIPVSLMSPGVCIVSTRKSPFGQMA